MTLNGQTIGYDTDGNTTSAPAPGTHSPLRTYGWNTRNQLTSGPGGMTAYTYDAEGLRTSYTRNGQTTTFVNDPSGPMSRVLWRIRPDGTRTFYIYGAVLLYEIEESAAGGNPANTPRYYHYDHLGSTLALTNNAGQVVARANYSAYGERIQSTGSFDTPFGWQGAFGVQTDPNGLHYMRARYYHARLGRFLSEDPIGFAGGDNFYAYANGNPIRNVDPTGLQSWADMRSLPNYTGPSTIPYTPLGRNTQFLLDFAFGFGDTERFYGPDTPETQDMRNSPGGKLLMQEFHNGGAQGVERFGYGTGAAYRDTVINPMTADWSSTAFQVGGFAGATATNNGNGTATFTIPNVAGTHSFFYHAVPDRQGTTGPMRTINQTFQWTEPIQSSLTPSHNQSFNGNSSIK